MLMPNVEDSLYRFLEEHGNDRIKRGLLLFWGMHPNARFDTRTICCAVDCHKLDAERALKAMEENGLVDKYMHNGVTLYSLSTNQERRRPVLELAALGWDQWLLLRKRIKQKINQLAPATSSL